MNVHSPDGTAMNTPATDHDLRTEQRSADILASVRFAFAQKGFDGASMQDLARAAGMSVGNFYRYFPSKSAIVEALIAHDLAQMQQDFAEIQFAARPIDGLREKLLGHIQATNNCADGQIWCEIAAVARRKPEIGLATLKMETAVISNLLQVFAWETGLSLEEVTHRFAAHAAFIMLLVKSKKLQTETALTARDALNLMIVKTLDQTLADISSAAVKDL
jgi:AcrR family transcriptional regulator